MSNPIAPVLVTGATGNVGREVVRTLQSLQLPFVAAGTNPEQVRRTLGESVQGSFLERPLWKELLDHEATPAATAGSRT